MKEKFKITVIDNWLTEKQNNDLYISFNHQAFILKEWCNVMAKQKKWWEFWK